MRGVAEYAAANPGREQVAEFMPQFRTRAHEDFFQIWDGKGGSLARSDSSAGKDLPRLQSVVGSADLPRPDAAGWPQGPGGRANRSRFAPGTRVALSTSSWRRRSNP